MIRALSGARSAVLGCYQACASSAYSVRTFSDQETANYRTIKVNAEDAAGTIIICRPQGSQCCQYPGMSSCRLLLHEVLSELYGQLKLSAIALTGDVISEGCNSYNTSPSRAVLSARRLWRR